MSTTVLRLTTVILSIVHIWMVVMGEFDIKTNKSTIIPYNFAHYHKTHSNNNKSQIRNSSLNIATWNINGLNSDIQYILSSNHHDILAIQEIHSKHFKNNIFNKIQNTNASHIIHGLEPPTNDKHSGVAFIVNKAIYNSIITSGSTSSRNVFIKLKTNFHNILIINVYLPYYSHPRIHYNDTLDEVKDIIYQHTTLNDQIIILGDLNGKLKRNSSYTGPYATAVRSNEVGLVIETFMEEFDLFAVNTKFKPRKNNSSITYRKSKGIFGQIDYILCTKRHLSGWRNCRVNWQWSKLAYGRKYDHGKVQGLYHVKFEKVNQNKSSDKIITDYFKIDSFKKTFSELAQNKYPNIKLPKNLDNDNKIIFGNAGTRSKKQKQLVKKHFKNTYNKCKNNDIICFTDGACQGNPGPAGSGLIVLYGKYNKNWIQKSAPIGNGTNNIGELYAIGYALHIILYHTLSHLWISDLTSNTPINIHIMTDSDYSVGVLSKNWNYKSNKELINWIKSDLKQLSDIGYNIQFHWVGGHCGIYYNEVADKLATTGANNSKNVNTEIYNVNLPPTNIDVQNTEYYSNNIIIKNLDHYIINYNHQQMYESPNIITENESETSDISDTNSLAISPEVSSIISLEINSVISPEISSEILEQYTSEISDENSSDTSISENSCDDDVMDSFLNEYIQTISGDSGLTPNEFKYSFIELYENIKDIYKETIEICKNEIDLYNKNKLKYIRNVLDLNNGLELLKKRKIAIENKNHSEIKSINKKIKDLKWNEWNTYLEQNIQMMEKAADANDTKQLYKIANKLARKSAGNKFIKPKKDEENDKMLDTVDDIIAFFDRNLAESCKSLESMDLYLNIEIPDDGFDGEYTNEKIDQLFNTAIKLMKNGKATGPGGVPIEVYKTFSVLQQRLKDIIKYIWHHELFPDEWANGDTLMFYKKNNINLFGNYRPLTLLNHEFKTMSRMLLLEIIDVIDAWLGDNQQGFRPHRSTRDNLLLLRWSIHIILNNKLEKVALFVDFKQAFPSVVHNSIIESLIEIGVRSKCIRLTKLMLLKAQIRFKYDSKNYGKYNPVNRGLLQGDTENPILYCCVWHHQVKKYLLFKEPVKLVVNNMTIDMKDFLFADDLNILEDDHNMGLKDLIDMDNAINDSKCGLNIHPGKSETLIISNKKYKVGKTTEDDCVNMGWKVKCKICNRPFPGYSSLPGHHRFCKEDRPYPNGSRRGTIADKLVREKKIEILLNDTLPQIEFKNNFIPNKFSVIYLGSNITMNGDIINEIRRRIGMASGAFRQYYIIFKSSKIRVEIKIRFYEAIIISIVLYGVESWPNIIKHVRKISRMITGHKRIIRNEYINDFKQQWDKENELLLDKIKKRKLKYLITIFSDKGCRKVKELVSKHIENPFFEFITNENYETIKSDAQNLSENNFIEKYI